MSASAVSGTRPTSRRHGSTARNAKSQTDPSEEALFWSHEYFVDPKMHLAKLEIMPSMQARLIPDFRWERGEVRRCSSMFLLSLPDVEQIQIQRRCPI